MPSNAPSPAAEGTDANKEAIIEYCLNIVDEAKEARTALQMAKLSAMKDEIESRLKALEEKRIEVQGWVETQKKLRSEAESVLVEIYSGMEPEAAALQMATLDLRLATSVLLQLKPRVASTILNEMKPDKAASLVKAMASAASPPSKDRK